MISTNAICTQHSTTAQPIVAAKIINRSTWPSFGPIAFSLGLRLKRAGKMTLLGLSLATSCIAHAAESTAPTAASGKDSKSIVVVGDSLSAEYGIERGTGWVSLLQKDLDQRKLHYQVRNASISGDTTSGGRSRLPAILKSKPGIVILELGSNDALRGLSLATSRDNLNAMVGAIKAAGAQIVLVGMQIPPNYGKQYTTQFEAMYRDLALQTKVSFVPFLLKGVANDDSLFQADRLHPVAAAHPTILKNVLPALNPLLKK